MSRWFSKREQPRSPSLGAGVGKRSINSAGFREKISSTDLTWHFLRKFDGDFAVPRANSARLLGAYGCKRKIG